MRSSILSVFGGAPDCLGIFGFVAMSRSPALGATFVAVGVDSGAAVRVLACCSAVEANLSASLSLVLPPQALARSAIAASTAARIRFFVMSFGEPPWARLPSRLLTAPAGGPTAGSRVRGYEVARRPAQAACAARRRPSIGGRHGCLHGAPPERLPRPPRRGRGSARRLRGRGGDRLPGPARGAVPPLPRPPAPERPPGRRRG